MEVRKVALPAALIPYSSWNSSLSKRDSSSFTITCENGSILAAQMKSNQQVCVTKHLMLGSIGLGRFCHAWSHDGSLVVAHNDMLYVYDGEFERRGELQLPYFAKHVAIHTPTVIVSTSNGAFIYVVDPKTWHITFKHHAFSQVSIGTAAFSPCGTWFGLAATDGRLSIWDTRSIEIVKAITLPSPRPTSLDFWDTYCVCVCKDAQLAILAHTAAAGWTVTHESTLKPDAASGYLSSSLVSYWHNVPFVSIVHSSHRMDVLHVETGRVVHRFTFPTHLFFMGLVALDRAMLLHDMQGNLYTVSWAFAARVAAFAASTPKEVLVWDGPHGQIVLLRQALRLERTASSAPENVPMPFAPPDLASTVAEDESKSGPSSFAAFWLPNDVLCVVLGAAVYRYSGGNWDVCVVPHAILQTALVPETAMLVTLGPAATTVVDVNALTLGETTDLPLLSPDVASSAGHLQYDEASHRVVLCHRDAPDIVVWRGDE
ncbi:Aste57867_16797 [Aphanomyces stellatus]|uniref:Aste57867_16797 protein n=1 Tax=Aphanomyces stellatus TaxID=120398 RepID=A0A485L7U1_9STRA|nr:hypothetical protein As57867_016740 [Aphanomyces stellatus]VFT93562.1 Aste57867_16797 [Aphanomyces stellatus]